MIEKRLWVQAKPYRRALLWSSICGIACAVTILGQAFLLASIVQAVFLQKQSLESILPQILLLWFVVTLRWALQVGESYFSACVGISVQCDLRKAILQKIAQLGPVAMRREQRGQVMYLLNEEIASLESYFSKYLPQLFQTAVIPCLFLCVIFPRDLLSGMILLLTAPCIPFFMWLIGKWTNKINLQQWKQIRQLSGYLHDVMAGFVTLKLLNQSKAQEEKIEKAGMAYAEATLRVLRWAFVSSLTLELFTTISIALVAVGLGLRLVEGRLDFETAFFLLLLAPEFYQPLRSLGAQFHISLNTKEAAASIYAFLEKTKERTIIPLCAEQEAAIQVQHGSIGYSDSSVPVLKDISFEIQPGEIIALVGKSGSGKTTLLHAMQGFLPFLKGDISLQAESVLISQKPYIFSGTILENLQCGTEHLAEKEIRLISQQTGLSQLLEQLPDGLHTKVGQGGSSLSGGQRQMIAIVRAICQQRSIVFLDEVTANLDLMTERALNQSLKCLLKGRTVVMAAHRHTTIQMADRIFVLEEGRIAEQGTEQQLLEKRGVYWELVQQEVAL